MTITLLLLLSAGLLVMSYFLWTLHSRLRLIERMDAQRKREARDLSKMQGEVEHYFSFVSEQQHKLLEVLGKVNDFTLKLAEKVLTKDEYQAPTAKPATLERVPRPLRTKPVMSKREEAKDESTITL
jgi:7-keto-8-aminopelargonate synthetase-like enzyme